MIIAIGKEMAFKSQCSFLTKILLKIVIEKNVNMIKVIKNPWVTLYLIFSDKTFPLIGNKSALTTFSSSC